MPRSLAYLETGLAEGRRVIGASSLGHDPVRSQFPEWVYLPYITAPDFDEALSRAIAQHDITGIFTPNPVVWDYLDRCIRTAFPGVRLINSSPVESEVAPYRKALQFADSVTTEPLAVAAEGTAKPSLSRLDMAALYHHADGIPGMCDHEKIRALCEIFRHAPSGDVVEIGSWWGKSAFVLSRLAMRYCVGKLLCVDPWSQENLVQKDEKGLVDRVVVNADEALTVFQINLLPYANESVNYLRLPSVQASVEYRRSPNVASPSFGETRYAGRIAVLHVDGNHSYESARADIAAWSDLVLPGGWIVIDDYVWPYGDGPRRVGDEFLAEASQRLEVSFVMGSALFIRIS
jgi:cephalosporin hydroxylase